MTARYAAVPPVDLAALAERHVPNTPREYNSAGEKVDEPYQCARCLKFWPCDIKQLLDLIRDAR